MTTIMVMASPISTSTLLSASSVSSKSMNCSFSPLTSYPKASTLRFSTLGSALFSQWNGLRHLGISISLKSLKLEKRGKCKGRVIHASLFGVGAPEALVIGVVALLVFGPKGLAEVARTLGKSLRAFQPTIRELQDVSREFKSTLEREIGLDEITNSTQNTVNRKSPYLSNSPPTPSPVENAEESGTKADPNSTPSVNKAYTSEEYLKITEEQLKASASEQQGQTTSPAESQLESQSQPEDGTPSVNKAYTSEEYLKVTEQQLKTSASEQQGQTTSSGESHFESQSQPEATTKETATAMPPSQKPESET